MHFKVESAPDDKPRESIYTGGEYNQPRPVICLDTNKIYPSGTEAAREVNASQGNLSMVCLGQRGRVNGMRFAYLDDHERGTVPKFTPYKGTIREVRCIDTGEIVSSMTEAAKAKGLKSPSHISRVCTGKRKSVGGLRWEYYKAD